MPTGGIAYFLLLILGATTAEELNPIARTSLKSSEIHSKLLIDDSEAVNQLVKNNETAPEKDQNTTVEGSWWENERYLTAACTGGASGCQTCKDATTCETCTNSATDIPDDAGGCTASTIEHCSMVASGDGDTCVACIDGFTVHGSGASCCDDKCSTCGTSSSDCTACIDGTHMSAAPDCECPEHSTLTGSDCVPDTGYYFSDATTCAECDPKCDTCDTSDGTVCTACTDTTHTSAAPDCECPDHSALTGSVCVPDNGYYFSDATTCAECDPKCDACDTSDGTVCTACTDTTHTSAAPDCECPDHSTLTGSVCVPDTGYYFSDATTCAECDPKCDTCDTSDGTVCTACTDTTHTSAAPDCECPDHSTLTGSVCVPDNGYYFSDATTCAECDPKCDTCDTSDGTVCTACTDTTHTSAAPDCECPEHSTLTGSVCVPDTGYYFSDATTCAECDPKCDTCDTSDGTVCTACTDTTHTSAAPDCECPDHSTLTGSVCVPDNGYYFSDATTCAECDPKCDTCDTSDGTVCTACTDTTHTSAAPDCECPDHSTLTGSVCVPDNGYYFSDATTCAECDPKCDTCDTSDGTVCTTCTDTTHMSAAPDCECPDHSTLTGSDCVPDAGYYFSDATTCAECDPKCDTCDTSDGTVCTACTDTTHTSAAPDCECPEHSTLTGSDCVPDDGYYFSDATTCAECDPKCDTCDTSDGTVCTACTDTTHTSAAPDCECPDHSTLTGSDCVPDNGYYFSDATTCAECDPKCDTCDTSDGTVCTACTDTTHMSAAPDCECPDHSALTGSVCVPDNGYYFSDATTCAECDPKCDTCDTSDGTVCTACTDTTHTSAAPDCECPEHSTLTGSDCVPDDGYYFSDATTCAECDPKCDTCDTSDGTVCTACTDTTHTSAAPDCECPEHSTLTGSDCVPDDGYYFSDATTCAECDPKCDTCDTSDGTVCTACTDTTHMSAAPDCECPDHSALTGSVCVPDDGYYFSDATTCAECDPKCDTCDTSDGTVCTACTDTTHTSAAPDCECPEHSTLTGSDCVPDDGYYFSDATTCAECDPKCDTCDTSDGTVCTACTDTTHTSAAPDCECPEHSTLTGSDCVPDNGYYFSDATTCAECDPKCETCDTTDGTSCTACKDATHMLAAPDCECPEHSTFDESVCVPDDGYYFSDATTCAECDPKCDTCDTSDGTSCTACTDTTHTSAAPDCECPDHSTLTGSDCVPDDGYYFSDATTCAECDPKCDTCDTTDGTVCTVCADTTHMSAAPDCECPEHSTLTGSDCVPDDGYYFSDATTCAECDPKCDTCDTTDGTSCTACTDTTHTSAAPDCECPDHSTLTGSVCVPDNGYYFSDATTCAECDPKCDTCDTSDGTSCTACTDTTHTSAAPDCECPEHSTLTGSDCVPDNGYYFSDATTCAECDPKCDTCDTSDGTVCTVCADTTHMSAAPDCECPEHSTLTGSDCVPDDGYYFSDATTCAECDPKCDTCDTSDGTSCTACTDTTHMLGVPDCACPSHSTFDESVCVPDDGYYFSDATTCAECDPKCDTCDASDGTSCTACTDTTHTSAAPDCECPEHSTLTGSDCVPDDGYYFSDATTCAECDPKCATCDTTDGTSCTACTDTTHMLGIPDCDCPTHSTFDSGTEVCVADDTYYFSSNTATSPCVEPCLWCSSETYCTKCSGVYNSLDSDGSCDNCLDDHTEFDTTVNDCVCVRGYYDHPGSCTKCMDNCAECVDESTCDQCDSSFYYTDSDSCEACDAPCKECVNEATYCEECLDASHMTLTDGVCTCNDENASFDLDTSVCTCNDYYYSLNAVCTACPGLCKKCSSNWSCSSCVDNAAVDNTNLCSCSNGYGKSGNTCQACKINCSICTKSVDTCNTCIKHASANSDGTCSCVSGFYQKDTKCVATCNQVCTTCSEDDGESCTACVTNAELVKSKCSCTANSSYDSNSQSCVCNGGYTLVSNKCIACKNYFVLSDVTDAYFDEYFSTITVTFSVGVDTTVSAACSNTIDWQSISKLGTGASCSWDGSNKLKIQLGKGFTIKVEKLYLLGTNIAKKEGTCSLNYTPLYITVRQTADPTPNAVISGPASYSLDCGNTALQYSGSKSTGNLNNPMIYTWSATSTPQNSGLTSYIEKQSSASLAITKLLFTSNVDSTLVVTLKVTNAFGGTNSASMTTAIKAAPSLQVVFDSGSTDTIKASDSRTYKASVATFCGDVSSVTYKWSYVALAGAPTIDSSAILSASKQQNKLVINKNMLPSGYSYQFNATATSQSSTESSVSGYSLLTITVTSSPLKIKLSKSSCTVASKNGFSINGDRSSDPDSSSTLLSYQWSCLYTVNATSCLGTDNKDLVSSATTSSLSIPSGKMIPGASYDITLLISAGSRNASATVTVQVSAATVASSSSIEIPYSSAKISAGSSYTLSPTATISSGSKIKWVCDSSAIKISPDNLPTISIPPNTFIQGSSYKFSFTITETSGNSLSSSIIVNINSGATCDGSVDIQPTSGTALQTTFVISIAGCYDQDGQDYPLTYSYDDVWNSVEYVLGATQDSSLSTGLFPNSNTIKIKACDQLLSCSTYQSKITVDSLKRKLEDTDYAAMYASATLDPDNIPSEISLIASSATIDNTLFSQMWSDLQSYAASQDSVSVSLFKSFAAAVLALSSQTDSMTVTLYENFMTWLNNLVTANSIAINTDASSILQIIVSLSNGYLDFGSKHADATMPFETYLLAADNFLTTFMTYITVDDLPGQSSLPASDSTSSIQFGKVRNFPDSISKTSQTFGFIDVTFPNKIPIDETEVTNFKANTYNITDGYAPWFSVSYTTSGRYQDYQYTATDEQYQSFNDDRYPVTVTIPYYKNATRGLSCVYYDTTTSTWDVNGCVITSQGVDTITVSLTHFSLFKLSETDFVPYIPPTYTPECGDNLAPTIIMIVSFFIGFVLMIITVFMDKSHNKASEKEDKKVTPVPELANNPVEPLKVDEMDKEDVEPLKVEALSEQSEPFTKVKMDLVQTEEVKSDPEKAQLAAENTEREVNNLGPSGHTKKGPEVDFYPKELYNEYRAKGNFRMLLEGHLTFGLVYYRKDLPRWRRAFILLAVIIFELLVEGCLFSGFEDTDKGREMSTQSIFDNYEGNYFGYTVLAVLIGVHLECALISCMEKGRRVVNILALLLGIAVLIGSVIGIVILNVDFCHNWSGYWAESFLWGILMEIFIVQIFYMLIRYIALLIKSRRAGTRKGKDTI
ncbi:unnamed protein product [Blepharisma stoltei]|uniref:EGF-like domain-containing protein n=1 Tax=Blepharisma stoltei TaxID=1481888 RepID=A0AAU9KHD8_9CILI|nr:unnamed protein product [Blepharisma stoltei]